MTAEQSSVYPYLSVNKAFTLIEILVVTAIVGVLTAAVVFNFVGQERSNALEREVRHVLSEIREVQNTAISAKPGNGEVPCGYGVAYEDQDTIIVFMKEPTGSYQCGDFDDDDRKWGSGSHSNGSVVEKIDLSETDKVKITGSFNDIFFEPPDGLVYINGLRSTGGYSAITFCLKSNCSTRQKEIRVYIGGRIEIE